MAKLRTSGVNCKNCKRHAARHACRKCRRLGKTHALAPRKCVKRDNRHSKTCPYRAALVCSPPLIVGGVSKLGLVRYLIPNVADDLVLQRGSRVSYGSTTLPDPRVFVKRIEIA